MAGHVAFSRRHDGDEPDDSAENMAEEPFYYFWRNIGRSQKDKMRLGRWGLGKQVFPASSGEDNGTGAVFGAGWPSYDRRDGSSNRDPCHTVRISTISPLIRWTIL